MPDYTNIDLTAKSKFIGHLFDIEIAILTATETASIGTDTVSIDKIGKCWQGSSINDCMILGIKIVEDFKYVKVKTINYLANSVTLYEALTFAIPKGSILFETLIVGATPITPNYLDVEQVSLGALDGCLHFTDLDIPVLTIIDGEPIPYIPFPVEYNEVDMNTTGKIADVTVTMANIDQTLSNFVLVRGGLRKSRNVRIHTCHLDAGCYMVKHINIPTVYNSQNYFICRTNNDYSLDTMLNKMLNYVYVVPDSVITEFIGNTKAITLTDKTAAFTIMNNVDNDSDITVPRGTYTRTRCRFLFKGEKCRFKSRATVGATINESGATEITLATTMDKPYLYLEMSDAELVVRIDSELFRIKKAEVKTIPFYYETAPLTLVYTIIERACSGTIAAAHSVGTAVDIVYCKKTEADCIARCNYTYFGTFPAIPKNIGESSGTLS